MICLGILPLISQERLNPMLPEEPSGATGTMAMLVSVASVYLGELGLQQESAPSSAHHSSIQSRTHNTSVHSKTLHTVHYTQHNTAH